MKVRFFCSAILMCLATSVAQGQHDHGDIEFAYDSLTTPTKIDVEAEEFTSDGIMFFEGDFDVLLGDFFAEDPGFESDNGITEGHQVFLRALDASTASSFGVGFVNYYNPLTDALEASGRIAIQDNDTPDATDLVLNGVSFDSGDIDQLIDGTVTSSNEAHGHVIIDLLDDSGVDAAPNGAYGMMFELRTLDASDNFVASSDAFWVVFNHGMDEEDFESQAVARFGVSAVPEPSSAAVILLGLTVMGVRRRR